MARFSFDGNPVLTETEFQTMISTDRGLREARYHGTYCDKTGRDKGHYVNWPSYMDVHDITTDQIERARRRFDERKAELRADYDQPGTLLVVTMGMDYPANVADGIGNHRVRVRFTDKHGDVRGIEFCPFWRANGNPDESLGFTVDRWNESEQERNERAYTDRMNELEAKYGKGKFIPLDERPEFPATYRDDDRCENLPFTGRGLARYIQRHHSVKFTRVVIDRHFFSCDELVSQPIEKGNAPTL